MADSKKKTLIDLALLAAAGGLYYVGTKTYDEAPEDPMGARIAAVEMLGGEVLLTFAAARIFNVRPYYMLGALAGVKIVQGRLKFGDGKILITPSGPLPTQSHADVAPVAPVHAAVSAALAHETEPAVLREFATHLFNSGHYEDAQIINQRAYELDPQPNLYGSG